ncbi:MAG TPA: PucR family transcriptional regulator ligand-binding domain-containing protein, partial [Rugosimonospora sp.]|nr:PucR family transcriptional regulator ligand-binding domain-containing protein [Rugosimonospora sp.]
MPVLLADLLAAPALNLVAVTGSAEALRRPVRWCAVTELADPRPWLQGGELVLTTGLRQRTATAQREFVAQVAERGVAGIGFGTGLSHERVPRATLAAARAADLPVLEVPYETPFLAVDRFVADRISAESYRRQRDLVEVHDALARALLSGGGLDRLLQVLGQAIGAPVAVVDAGGTALSGDPVDAGGAAAPIELTGTVVAHLRAGVEH